MRDWKTQLGVLLVTIGVTGLIVHQRAVERAQALDDQRSAERWTPDDTAIIIEQEELEQEQLHGRFPACGCGTSKLMDQPLGDYPTPPLSRSQLDTLDFNRPGDQL